MKRPFQDDGRPFEIDIDEFEGLALKAMVDGLQRATTFKEDRRVNIERLDNGKWQLSAMNVVGLIGAGERTIVISSKIPLNHLLYLAGVAKFVPSFEPTELKAAPACGLVELILRWFLDELELLLYSPLFRDYRDAEVVGETWNGALDPMHVARRFYEGVLEPKVTADVQSPNTAVNRVLRAALEVVAELRGPRTRVYASDAQGLLKKFDGVGDLQPGDRDVPPSRRMAHYETAWTFACHILDSISRSAEFGDTISWCFLLPSAAIAEDGLRAILRKTLWSHLGISVSKSRTMVKDSRGKEYGFNPDLVFKHQTKCVAVGDVKYKIALDRPFDQRADLNQAIAFATAAGVQHVVKCQFGHLDDVPRLQVGNIHLASIKWQCGNKNPLAARKIFVAQVKKWLSDSVLKNGTAAAASG